MKPTILCGDFNVKFGTDSKDAIALCDLLVSFGFIRTIYDATRGPNCIDNIFISEILNNYKSCVFKPCVSDHDAQYIELVCNSNNTALENKVSRPITMMGKHKFYEALCDIDWGFVDSAFIDINTKFDHFLDIVEQAHCKAFPEKILKIKNGCCFTNNWFNKDLELLREQVYFFNDLYRTYQTQNLRELKNSVRKIYQSEIRIAKMNNVNNYISRSSNKSRATWNCINYLKGRPNVTETCSIGADEFNHYFVNVAENLIHESPASAVDPIEITPQCGENFCFKLTEISFNETRDTIDSLRNNNSTDFYGFNTTLLKVIKDIIVVPLTKLINLGIRNSVYPSAFKISKVVPVFKGGNSEEESNYRPISLIVTFSKVFEKLLKNKITHYLESNFLLSQNQFGFRKNKSTSSAIVEFVQIAIDCFERGLYSTAVFVDLSKAFDCVSHNILLKKLERYNFENSAIRLISSYLQGRRQVVHWNGTYSDTLYIKHGVPQGSILGPILFLIYINDFSVNLSSCRSILFADDTTLLNSYKNFNDASTSSTSMLKGANEWFVANALTTNNRKTQTMILSLRELSTDTGVNHVKFLGVWLDSRLDWNAHGDSLADKLTRIIYSLRYLSNHVSPHILKSVYFANFHSVLCYGVLSWGHAACRHRLFSLQRRAVRVVAGLGYRDDCREIFIRYNILTLPSVFALECLLYAKENTKKFNTNGQYHEYETRANALLRPEFFRLSKSQTGPNYWAIKFYNVLPAHIKCLPREQFKQKIKGVLLRNALYDHEDFFRLGFGAPG